MHVRSITGSNQLVIDGIDLFEYGYLDKGRYNLNPEVPTFMVDGNVLVFAIEPSLKDPIVGVWLFERKGNRISSEYTWVHPNYRRIWLAKRLWRHGLRKFKVRHVKVEVTTDKGLSLIDSVREEHKSISFTVRESGGRKLRNMRASA